MSCIIPQCENAGEYMLVWGGYGCFTLGEGQGELCHNHVRALSNNWFDQVDHYTFTTVRMYRWMNGEGQLSDWIADVV